MSDQIADAIRIVAEFDGWSGRIADGVWHSIWHLKDHPETIITFSGLSKRLQTRDALIEVAKKLSPEQRAEFTGKVYASTCDPCDTAGIDRWHLITADASVLLLALAATIKEGKSL